MPTLLEVKGLHAGYGETRVLHGLDFVVDEGGVTALLGANGAGKTTTLRAICGMVRTAGRASASPARASTACAHRGRSRAAASPTCPTAAAPSWS